MGNNFCIKLIVSYSLNSIQMKKLFFILVFCQWVAVGQTPSISINLSPNPSADTATWGSGNNIFNIVVAGANMAMLQESDVLVTIKSNGTLKCGGTAASAQASNIVGNAPKSWIGTAAQGLLNQECILSPGSYEVCVQFFGFKNGPVRGVLLEKCVPFTIPDKQQEVCSPPLNVNPTNQKEFSDKDLLSIITFNWSPIISSYKGLVTYQLVVWEVEDGQTNAQAIYNNQPIIQIDVKGQTRYVTRPGLIEKRNAKYVWRVIALDAEGNIICKTSESEPTNFEVKIPEVVSTCIDFEGEYNISNWKPFYVATTSLKTDLPHKNYLQLVDDQGPSFAVDYVDFAGNWLEKGKNGCLCFDYMVDWEGKADKVTRSPAFFLYHGIPISTAGSGVSFGTSYYRAWIIPNPTMPVIVDAQWRNFCLPIALSANGQLPSNAFGQWQVVKDGVVLTGAAACVAWDYLIQNVTGFCLGTDYNGAPSELVNFDNFCWSCSDKVDNPVVICCDETTKEGCLIIDKSDMTIVCNGVDKEGKTIYKVSNIKLKNTSSSKAKTGLTSNIAGTNYVSASPSGSFAIKNISPVSSNPISSGQEINISFDVSGLVGSSLMFTIEGAMLSKNAECDKIFEIKIDKLPECSICTYCLDKKNSEIKLGSNIVATTPLNIMTIAQDFTIAPKNIKRVTAEIISFDEDAVTESCMKCIVKENTVGNFIGSNTETWNSGMAMNGSPVNSDGYYPAKTIEWHCNKQGTLQFNFKIALPGAEVGCKRKGKVGIRYSFTDVDCITCEKIIYYNFTTN